MSARKSATAGGAKPDNNNVSSPTLELDATLQGDEAAAVSDSDAGAATEDTVSSSAAAAVTEAPSSAVTADDAKPTSTPEKDQDSNNDSEKQEDSTTPSIPESGGTPRKTSTEGSTLGLGATKNVRVTRLSSPFQLSWSPTTAKREGATGASCSDSEEQPSGSSSSTASGSQRKSSVERQSGGGSGSGISIIRGRKSIKELKEAKEAAAKSTDDLIAKEESSDATEIDGVAAMLPEQDSKELKETKDNSKSVGDVKASDKDKESKEKDKEKEKEKEKETTPTPASTTTTTTPITTTTTCNRVTRKAHAQELALAFNTRVTRNRRQSSTVNTEPQLPARGRRKKPAPPEPKELLKRKRSDDDTELGVKIAKIKEENDQLVIGDMGTSESPLYSIKIELLDSEEQQPATPAGLPSPAAAATPTQQSANRRGRGRPQTKGTPNTTTSTVTATTSTRATRYSKAGSPGLLTATPTEPTPPKRRRVGSTNRSLLATKATSASSSSLAASSHGAGDEDSKDSLASSMDDLLPLGEIKQEKIAMDFEENFDGVSKPAPDADLAIEPAAESTEEPPHASTSTSVASNGIEPLTVDTDTTVSTVTAAKTPGDVPQATQAVAKDATTTASAEGVRDGDEETESNEASKAPSLSPEMISEGVSAISVKQFYKKPEFLANNLGIEKDPELGEIVQIATETETTETSVVAIAAAETTDVVDGDLEAEAAAEVTADADAKPADDSYSTGMDELRVDESGDETDQDAPQFSIPKPATTTTTTETVTDNAVKVAKELSLPSELNGGDKTDQDYDDIESDIMKQLAKEGVVDASGNALSASKHNQEQLEKIECDTDKQVKNDACDNEQQEEELAQEEEEEDEKKLPEGEIAKELVVTLEVEPFTEEQEVQANAEVDDDDTEMQILDDDCNDCPEENKENVSTTPADVIAPVVGVTNESSMDIDLALKVEESVVVKLPEVDDAEEDNEEEKPLATVAAEQKTTTLPKLETPKTEAKMECKTESKSQLKGSDVCEERRREKELHLQHLGLLTHQAAELLRQELIQEAHTRAVHQQHLHQQSGKRNAAKGSAAHTESSGTLKTVIKLNRSSNGGAGVGSGLPTGTVVHGSGAGSGTGSGAAGGGPNMAAATRKGTAGLAGAGSSAHGVRRQSLKMTFQKGRARGHGAADRTADHHGAHAEDSYYTIQNEVSVRANRNIKGIL